MLASRHRTLLVSVLSVMVLAFTTLAVPASARSGDRAVQRSLLAQLDGRTIVTQNATTQGIGYLGGTARRPVISSAALGHPASARAASRAFLARFGQLFGVANPSRDLVVSHVERAGGRTFVRYQQKQQGVPVIAGELIVQVSRGGDIVSVNGETSPDLSIATRPTLRAARARAIALEATARSEHVKAATLRASQPVLSIYDPRLTGDTRALPMTRLVWKVDVTSTRAPIREFVGVDAQTGVLVVQFNQIAHVDPPANSTQRVCDANNVRATLGEGASDPLQCDPGDATLVAAPGSSGVPDVLGAFDGAEATYDFFARHFGRNSLDDAGMTLISTARFCTESTSSGCPYANAFWNGTQMYYGDGYAAADDVVGHELTHGVTEFTSGLLYFFQSGAINESLSDIFGEWIDLEDGLGTDTEPVRWLLGEDVPGLPSGVRNMKDPTISAQGPQPDRMSSLNWTADGGFTDQGGVHTNSGVGNKAAYLVTDGATFNGQTVSGLGIDKASAIFYRASSRLLTTGSDYAALADALHQACGDLVGTRPLDETGAPSSSGDITTSNCTQVDKAVTATEMRSSPPTRAIAHAKLCSSGTATVTPFFDQINATAAGWVTNDSADGASLTASTIRVLAIP